MAEVKIEIVAEDRASEIISSVRDAVLGAAQSVQELAGAVGGGAFQSGVERLRKALAGLDEDLNKTVTLDTTGALQNMGMLDRALASVPDISSKALMLDASGALFAAAAAKAAIDAIPDVTYKTVVVQYKTQASPVMDFTEGMEHIREMMGSLPEEGTYTVNVAGLADMYQQLATIESRLAYNKDLYRAGYSLNAAQQRADEAMIAVIEKAIARLENASGTGTGTGAEVVINMGDIHVQGVNSKDGNEIARDIQRTIAVDIRNRRSPITSALREVGL